MFSIREYIKEGFLKAIGNMPEYKIILNSAGWLEKGVLQEEDLAEISQAIEEHSKIDEIIEEVLNDETLEDTEEQPEEPIEEQPEENIEGQEEQPEELNEEENVEEEIPEEETEG